MSVISCQIGILALTLSSITNHAPSALAATNPDAVQLLREAEAIRNPNVSYQATIRITDDRRGKRDEKTMRVKSKNQTTTVVEYMKPAIDIGTKVLMLDDDMWVAMPKSAKPIRIAPRQKLVGNAAYGDITSINYADSYDPELKGEDTYEGRKIYVLMLRAKQGKSVTYEAIEYSIDKATKRPVKASYMTASGKTLRTGIFTGYHMVLGVERPLKLVLRDALDSTLTTTIEFLDAEEKTFPSTLFQKDALK